MRRIEIHGMIDQPGDEDEKSIEVKVIDNQSSRELPEVEAGLPKTAGEERMAGKMEEWKDKYLGLYAEVENTKKAR